MSFLLITFNVYICQAIGSKAGISELSLGLTTSLTWCVIGYKKKRRRYLSQVAMTGKVIQGLKRFPSIDLFERRLGSGPTIGIVTTRSPLARERCATDLSLCTSVERTSCNNLPLIMTRTKVG